MLVAFWLSGLVLGFALPAISKMADLGMPLVLECQQFQPRHHNVEVGFLSCLVYDAELQCVTTATLSDLVANMQATPAYDPAPTLIIRNASSPRAPPAVFLKFLAAETTPNIVYRALTQADADALAAGRGLTAKAPNGTWTAAEHVANAGPGTGGARLNSPWISTSSRLDVAQAYDSGNGVIAIDLNKVASPQVQVWQTAPRVNGVQGLPFQRSFWAEETTVFQQIPFNAILGPVK
jgi:hypothetical protein